MLQLISLLEPKQTKQYFFFKETEFNLGFTFMHPYASHANKTFRLENEHVIVYCVLFLHSFQTTSLAEVKEKIVNIVTGSSNGQF